VIVVVVVSTGEEVRGECGGGNDTLLSWRRRDAIMVKSCEVVGDLGLNF
jgi:hypothetical protein